MTNNHCVSGHLPSATPAEIERYRNAFLARGGLAGPTRARDSVWVEYPAVPVVVADDRRHRRMSIEREGSEAA